MKVQVLASIMNSKIDIYKKMNIKTDSIIVNQCNENNTEEVKVNKNVIKFYSYKERGVGLSRNRCLELASNEILIFADDDIKYVDNYEKLILDEFDKYPNADMIFFNVPSLNKNLPTANIEKSKKISFFKSLRYGAVNIAIKKEFIEKNDIKFSLLFGGGAKYSCGEDSLFIKDVFKHGGNVYISSKIIAYVAQEESTWFKGYDEKYFNDKGVLYYNISNSLGWLYSIYYLIRHKKEWLNNSFLKSYKVMLNGMKKYKIGE